MSATGSGAAMTPSQFMAAKGGAPLVCLTAYTTPVAKIVDEVCDLVLVGDSVGMVLHGMDSTLGVTMDMMVMHGQAVARGLSRSLMVVDMPFGSYEEGPQQAFRNAARLMRETGAAAVKLEGGESMEETIRFLASRSIPVMAHVGLTPQAINTLGGYKVQGRGEDRARVLADAQAVERAGAFSVVLEKVPSSLSEEITQALSIPTIGIGAGSGTDGQVLVVDDMLGLFDMFKPKFAKRYASLAEDARAAVAAYGEDVRARRFPAPEHSFDDET